MKDIGRYDRELYLLPIWKGTVVYGETVFALRDFFGQIRPFRLAYPIETVVSVRSADLSVTYEAGRDYRVNEFGELEVVPGGKIPFLSWDNYRLPAFDPSDDTQLPAADGLGAYRMGDLFRDREGMRAYRLAVSYTHPESGRYDIAAAKSEKLPRFLSLLKGERAARVVSFGDSITYGWGASGMRDIEKPPYCKRYTDMITDGLAARYGANITLTDCSLSGMGSDWGMKDENIRPVVAANPDLVVLAFGMNDAGVTRPERFERQLTAIIDKIRGKLPETEFLLMSSILPNPLVGFSAGSSILHYHREYPRVLANIEREKKGVAFADVTAMHRLLLERKSIGDTLSNNVNHPNDFMHRIYAQVALKTIAGE